jgi:FkbM family methyltransferase
MGDPPASGVAQGCAHLNRANPRSRRLALRGAPWDWSASKGAVMPNTSLSARLAALIDPYLAGDARVPPDNALDPVPEPLKSLLAGYAVPAAQMARLRQLVTDRKDAIDALERALDDAVSQDRLLQFLAARILGPTRMVMTARDRWIAHLTAHGRIEVTGGSDGLDLHALRFEGCDLRYLAPFGNAISPFLERQYFLERGALRIRPERGEVAMDFGAGAGDTALAFAAAVGAGGRVLACEPTPSEQALLARNLAENAELAGRITPIAAAVADTAGRNVLLAGDATHAHIAPDGARTGARAVTTTIDALVAEHDLPRLDFIKLDIEGMELAALQGATRSLERFSPKLAVCVYHGWQVFDVLPWLRARLPNYTLHLETHAPIAAETVLYARPVRAADA